MVNEARKDLRNGHGLQDLAMPSMSGESEGTSPGPHRERYLNGRAMLSHFAHLRESKGPRPTKCGFCRGGLEAVIKTVAEPQPDVVPSDRIDETEPAPSPPDRWWDRKQDGEL